MGSSDAELLAERWATEMVTAPTNAAERAARIEAKAKALLETLPRCTVLTCGKPAVVNARIDGRTKINHGPAYRRWLCDDCYTARCKHTSETTIAPWAEAARELSAEVGRG